MFTNHDMYLRFDHAADNWIAGAPVRTDLTEGQLGVEFVMDVGVMDMSTCEAMDNALVELWSANATGQYGATFLRGGTTTDSTGIAELTTIFPGFTPGEAAHFGVKVYPNWSGASTITGDTTSYNGRLYFTDQWSVVIGEWYYYDANPVKQTLNAQDPYWAQANSAGFNPVVDIEEIGDDWPEGILGYITIGVNSKASYAT
ncbi:aromatic compound dioxygenase [Ramaria rubella]|nr:aromatic compound dioxygenase [Ramaria rubella]